LAGGAELLLEDDIIYEKEVNKNWPEVQEVTSKSDRKPRNVKMEEETRSTFDAWTLDFTVNLHHTTQTRRNTMPKAIDHALITFCNSFCHFFRSFTIV